MNEQKSAEGQEDTREDLLQRTVELLFSMARQIHRGVAPQDLGLSPAQARLVFIIAKCGDAGMSVKESARLSDMTPGAITQFADALIAKGLISREDDPDDRRVVRLKLTPTAKSQMKSLRRAFLASVAGSFDVLSTVELRQLNDLLAKVGFPNTGE